MYFQYTIPVKQLDYKIEIPEYITFNKTYKGYYSIPLKESSKRNQINFKNNNTVNYTSKTYTFTDKNIPRIKDNEPFSGNINNYRGRLDFEISRTKFPNTMYKSYTTSWEKVCKTIYQSSNFGKELEKSNYYKDDLTSIISSSKNEYEKTKNIFSYIKSKVKWNEYYSKYTNKGVKKAYKEGTGNTAEINLMLTSMLRFAGLNANPVLVSTKNNGIPIFPTREGFNYVISKVNLSNGKYILLDATEKNSYLNILPYRTLNWFGREILKNGASKEVNLIPTIHTKENNILHVKLDEAGAINGMFRKSLTGHNALFYCKKNNVQKTEKRLLSLEEKYAIEIENFKILNKDKLSKPIVESLKFSGDDFVEEINDKLYFSPLFFLATKENPFKSKERNFPVDYGMPWQDKFAVVITIPEGYTVASFPKELAIGLPDNLGVFKYKIAIQANKIKLSSILKLNSSMIVPQYYTTLRDFYTQFIKKQAEKIVLIKKSNKIDAVLIK